MPKLNSPLLLFFLFLARDTFAVDLDQPTIHPGKVALSVTEDKLPWGGYWWKYQGAPIASSKNSPLAKYDQFVQSQTGINPGAALWEMQNHNDSGETGNGHCDGWSAASLLFPEPTRAKKDPHSGVIFFQSDIKALYTELATCATAMEYGFRYNDPNDDPRDPSPILFHQVLSHYLTRNTPVAMDMKPYEAVNNHVVTAVEFEITPAQKSHTYFVKASVTDLESDFNLDDSIHNGLSRAKTIYSYTLTTDSENHPLFGEWLSNSSNPDFLWVPTGIGACDSSHNARINLERVKTILDLPDATPLKQTLTRSFTKTLQPNETATLTLPKTNGTDYTLSIVQNGFGDGTLLAYGVDRIDGTESVYRRSPSSGEIAIQAKVSSLDKIEIKNTTNHPLSGTFSIKGFSYFELPL